LKNLDSMTIRLGPGEEQASKIYSDYYRAMYYFFYK